ncbi:MAG: PKD domain-containing protein [Flavobacteriales bacterium]
MRVYTAPQANFDATPVPGCINTPITFTNTSVLGYNNSCSQTALFTWTWGDGSPNTVVTTNAAQSHTYTAAGNYTVTLSAQNSCGTTTISQVVCIETPPTPVFTVDNNLGCVPMTVSTTNTSNNGIPCSVNYSWIVDYTDLPCAPNTGTYSFTGGTTASSLEPDFLLSSVGTYTIRLQMTNSCGVFQDTETVTVNTTPVVAVNTIATICSGNTVTPVGVVNACNLPITSYAWNLPGGSPATANTLSPGPITYAAAGTYTATLTATNACGPSSGSATVNVLAPPVVNISTSTGSTAFCSGSNVSLTASGAANYTWMPGNLSGSTINISPTSNTTYTVTGTSGSCTDQETISITINPLPTVTPTGAFSMCTGETEQLSVNVNGGTAPYTNYSWNNGATLSSTSISNPISSATTTTTYTVQVTDSNGCVGVGNVPVTVNPLPVVNAGPDNQLCNQPVATALTGYSPTTGGTGVWSGPGVTSNGTFTPSAIGCFDLTYTFTNGTTGCANSDIVQICVVDPVPADGGPDLSACFGAPAVALPTGGTWSGTNVAGNTFTPATVGTYTLTFTVGSGSCQTSDNIQATVLAAPVVNAGTDIANMCAGETVQLNGTANSANGAITSSSWTSPCGGISDATVLNPNITPSTGACTYTLSATDAAGCQATDQVLVNVNALPVVNAGADLVLCNQPIATTLSGFNPAGGTWSADPGIGLSGTNVTPQGVGVFNLTYTYTNPTTNCTNTDIVVVTINDPSNTDAGPDVELCLNSPVYNIIAPTPGGTWTVTPQVTATGAFTPSTVGTYNLTYTVGSGTCATSDNMNVIVNGLPTIDVGPDGSICLNDSLAVNGTVSGGEAPYVVSWNFPATLSNPNSAVTFAFPSVTTNYTVTVTDNNQCVDTDNIIVTVNGLPTVNAGNDLILCDQPIEEVLTGFSPTSGGTGTWTGTGIVDPSGSFLSPGVGSYWLYYEFTAGGNACANTDSILVTVNAPVIADAGSDLTFCLNDAQYTFTGVTPAAGGTWSGDGITNTSAGIFNPSVAGVGNYTITIEYGSGTCYTTDDVDITVLGLPTVDAGPDDAACGNADPFDMSGYTPATGGIWEGPGITNSTTGNFDPAIGMGTYDVFLWYTDPLTGCADTAYKVVNVSPVPNAAFTVPAQGCTNSPADIVNNSTGATQYDWDFGDGTTFSDIDPVYTYPDEGFFDIMLVAINNFGCRDTMILNNEIVDPPSAQFNLLPSEGCAPLVVDFENVSVGQYLSFEWDLSITTSINQTPQTLTYQQGPDVMIYPITLTATNYCGSDQAVDEVTVFPQPVAGFGTNMDVFCSPFTVLFNNTSTGLPDTYEWNFGDGSPNVFVEEPISHVFYTGEEPTDYTIYLYLENECGLDTAEYTITVLPNTVTSFFNTNITQGCSPLEVEFTDFSEGGNQIQYNFGDGTFTGTANPTHTFDDAGEYTIYQYVDNGCSYDTTFIVIEVYPSPDIDFTTNDASICVNEGIQFTPQYTDVVGITWDFGDGSTSTLSAPLHVFETSGQYIVTATAESDNQCTTDVTHPVTVYSAPTTAFTVPDQVGCSPFNICFSDASQGAVFYEWDFGDGNTDNIAEPCNLYENFTAAPQLYTIRLITQNMQLCSDTTYMDVIVSPQPVAAYTLSTFESCYFPVEAHTTNFSNYANGYSWLLDGEEISDLTNTTFEFNEVGTYNTTLIASNQYGCSSESSIDYTVHPLPVIGLDALPYEGCVPLLVDFQNISTGANAFEWDFGDGNTSNAFSPTHNYTTAGFYDVSLIELQIRVVEIPWR